MEEFLTNLLTKIGFNAEDAAEAAKEIADEMYYSYDYDDDYDWDTDEYIDTDLNIDDDIDDEQYWQENDPYADDIVIAGNNQAYLVVIDSNFTSTYMNSSTDTLGYNATVADIKGNGTYTVKVTADTDGYKNIMQDIKPEGLMMLGIEADGMENIDNAVMEIKSIKVDGKEMSITGETYSETMDTSLIAIAYSDGEDDYCMFDGSSIGEWTDIEVTFEVKGME